MDRDPWAIEEARKMQSDYGHDRMTVVDGVFSRMDLLSARSLPPNHRGRPFDGIVLDVGVSSMQVRGGIRENPLTLR